MSFSNKLKDLRVEKNLRLQDLTAMTGISQGLLSHYERGIRDPGLENITKIARALGVPIDYFADYEVYADTSKPLVAIEKSPFEIPIVGLAQAGRGGFFGDNGEPLESWDEKVMCPADLRNVRAYAVRVDGDSMEPFIKKGHILICVTNKEPHPGDYVVVQLISGEVMVKEYYREGDTLILKSINPLHQPVIVPASQVRAVHPIAWVKRR